MRKRPAVGAVVLAHFPFTDLTGAKRRPAVVIAHANGEDLVVAYVSSQLGNTSTYDIPLSDAEKDFSQTGLHLSSVVCIDKLTTLSPNVITGRLGQLPRRYMHDVRQKIKKLFQL